MDVAATSGTSVSTEIYADFEPFGRFVGWPSTDSCKRPATAQLGWRRFSTNKRKRGFTNGSFSTIFGANGRSLKRGRR